MRQRWSEDRSSNALKVCACMKWCLAFSAIATTPRRFPWTAAPSLPGADEGCATVHTATHERKSNDDHVRLDRYETNGYETADEWEPAAYVEIGSTEKDL